MNAILWVCPGSSASPPARLCLRDPRPAPSTAPRVMPQWFLSGLTLAGKMLPAVGIAMLLRYMPTGKYFQYLLVGFFLSAASERAHHRRRHRRRCPRVAFYQRVPRGTPSSPPTLPQTPSSERMSNHGKREHHRRRRGQALRLQGHQEGPAQRELALAHERVHLQLPDSRAPQSPYALSPVLRKIYTNDEDYKQALNNHFRYYNTQPWLAAIILGACVAMEERDGLAAADAVQDLKIGTMGPLAGVGDSCS